MERSRSDQASVNDRLPLQSARPIRVSSAPALFPNFELHLLNHRQPFSVLQGGDLSLDDNEQEPPRLTGTRNENTQQNSETRTTERIQSYPLLGILNEKEETSSDENCNRDAHETESESNLPFCSICRDCITDEDELFSADCRHQFHKSCLNEWLRHGKHCPNCREQLREALTIYEWFQDSIVALRQLALRAKLQASANQDDLKTNYSEKLKRKLANLAVVDQWWTLITDFIRNPKLPYNEERFRDRFQSISNNNFYKQEARYAIHRFNETAGEMKKDLDWYRRIIASCLGKQAKKSFSVHEQRRAYRVCQVQLMYPKISIMRELKFTRSEFQSAVIALNVFEKRSLTAPVLINHHINWRQWDPIDKSIFKSIKL